MLNSSKLMARLLSVGLLLGAASAQQVSVVLDSGSTIPGGTIALNLSLTSSRDALPAGVQWTFNYLPSVIVNVGVAAGSTLTQAGKSLICSSSYGATTCIAYGLNQNVLNVGPLATATFKISPDASTSPTLVQVTSVIAVAANGTAIPGSGQTGTITVSQPASSPSNLPSCPLGTLSGASTSQCTNSAVFVKTDTTTQGSWKQMYGGDGYTVIDDTASLPSYVALTPVGPLNNIWAGSTADVRGLQKAVSSDRIAASWFSYATFEIDLNFTDGLQHQLAIYCVDWDTGTRQQTIRILDGATNVPLDSETLSSFQNGKYLVWNVKGHVTLQVFNTGGNNAVISGLFFDTTNIGSNSAVFIKTDTTTQGNWKQMYGGDGYTVIDDTASLPSYVALTPVGPLNNIWAGSTADVRGLQKAVSSDRIAASWFSYATFEIDLNFTDGLQHQLAIYCVDWDTGTRQQTIRILDGATKAPLDSETLTNFQNGKYLVWTVKGHVTLQVVNTGGNNAVISGLFFDTTNIRSNSAVFIKTDTTTQGSWKQMYGGDGYTVIDDTASLPNYVALTPVGPLNNIWAISTADVRGLQKGVSSDRIAASWFSYATFEIDLNFTDGLQHQLAVYCVDWDTGTRQQTLRILDGATNAPLDSETLTTFQNGKYLVWTVKGHVTLQVLNTGGNNAVISGLFFDTKAQAH